MHRRTKNIQVVIWGNDNYNVLGLLRQLSIMADEVLFLVNGKKGYCACKSQYCRNVKVSKSIDDAIDILKNVGESLHGKAHLITTSDLLAVSVDLHSDELSKFYFLSSTRDKGTLSKFLNKNEQYSLAQKVGIKVPTTTEFYYSSSVDDIHFPCLIKPAFKKEGVHHPFKTCICRTPLELKQKQETLDPQGTYTLQRYIEKDNDLLVYGCRLYSGDVLFAGSFVKYRWSNGDGSYGFIDGKIPECINIEGIKNFLSEINYYGLFSAEFGVENGEAWFYEFNLRNDGTSHYFYQAGLKNIPLIWVNKQIQREKESDETKHCVFIDEIGDYENVKIGFVGKKEWKKQFKTATVFKYYDKDDIKPYLYVRTIVQLKRIYRLIFKRKHPTPF